MIITLSSSNNVTFFMLTGRKFHKIVPQCVSQFSQFNEGTLRSAGKTLTIT